MKLHQKINGHAVLASYLTNDGTVLLIKADKGVDTEYIVARCYNGQDWTTGMYFHSADYGTAERAKAAAKGAFLYRSGLDTSTTPERELNKYDRHLREQGVKFIIVGSHPSSVGPTRKTLNQ